MKPNFQNIIIEYKKLQKENEEIKARLSINKKIIQEFFKNSAMKDKISVFVENIKQENIILLTKIDNLTKEKEKLIKICNKIPEHKIKNIEIYENKLFVYENLLKEKQSIIINLKEQNKNLKKLFESKFKKEKIQIENNQKDLEENIIKENEDKKEYDNNNKIYILEEIYVTSPHKVVNTLNNKIEFYKSINNKLKYLIQELKTNLSNKEKEYLKLEEEAMKIKQELQKFTQMKNNEEIINQLIQYQSMKSIPISQSCSNLKVKNNEFKNARNKNKKTKSSSYIMTYSNIKKEKIMKEIEVYENINKTVKELSDNDFDLAGEWAETLKHCGMTQEEFLRFCGMKITNKLTNAIEYLYKILIDKNIQIKLLTQENETLNEENIRLNKINIEMESLIEYYQSNKNNRSSISIEKVNKEKINNDKNRITRNNSFFGDYKNKFLKESKKNKFNNSSSQNELQSTFVNVDNNITHTNININMMMDYDHLGDINKNSITSSEFRDGLLLNDLNNNYNNNKNKNHINNNNNNNNNNNINKSPNLTNYNLIENKKFIKSKDKVLRYLKLNNRKIKNKSYNKLILDNKNDINEKSENISTIKKSSKNFDKTNDYNRTIKNIFSSTEKIQIKKIKKNISPIFKTNEKKQKKLKLNNINMDADAIINNLKLIQKNKYKRNENENNNIHPYNHCKSENNKIFKIYKKYTKIK